MGSEADRQAEAGAGAPAGADRVRPALDPLDPFAELNADLDELREHRRDMHRMSAAQYRVAARIVLRSGASPHEKSGTPLFRTPSAMEWRALKTEVALALHVGEPTAEKILGWAPTLVNDLPRTMAAFSDGRISESHARTLAEQSAGLTPSEREGLETVLLPLAEAHAPASFTKRAKAERDKRRPEGAEERAKKAAATDAGVWLDHAADGRACLSANVDAVDGAAMFDRITSMAMGARNTPGEMRSLQELRAAAFADLLLTGVATDGAGTGIAGQVFVAVPALSMLGASTDLAELSGHGPIDVGTAAKLLADSGSFSRVITDPITGDLLAVDRKKYRTVPATPLDAALVTAAPSSATAPTTARTTAVKAIGSEVLSRVLTDSVTGSRLTLGRAQYRPPEEMKRWVRLRDGVCMFPDCNRAARRCELDHIEEWARDEGKTNAVNLMCLCPMHHALKTMTAWNPVAIGGGSIEWTSPAGRVYRKDPQHRMEPISGVDVILSEADVSEADVSEAAVSEAAVSEAAVSRATVTEATVPDLIDNDERANDLPAVDTGTPTVVSISTGRGRRQRLYAEPNAEWLASLGWALDPAMWDDEDDACVENYDGADHSSRDLGDPPPDPPLWAYFPDGVPISVILERFDRGLIDQKEFDRELRDYVAIE